MKKGMKIHNLKRILSAAMLLVFVILLMIYVIEEMSGDERETLEEYLPVLRGEETGCRKSVL